MAARFTEFPSNRHRSETLPSIQKKLSLVSIAPLGSPVVPDV